MHQCKTAALYEQTLRYQPSARALVAVELILSSRFRAIEQAASAVFALLLKCQMAFCTDRKQLSVALSCKI